MVAKAKPKPKLKRCTAFIKVVTPTEVKLEQCSGSVEIGLGGLPCPLRGDHMLRYRTGFCEHGWCEGTSAKTKSGQPAPTCTYYLTCPCKCHRDLDFMFKMSGMERLLVEKSEYRAPERTWWMPSDEPFAALSNNGGTTTPLVIERAAPGIVPPTIVREYGPTESGRTAKGELESWVKSKCDEWMIEQYQFPCSPSWLAAQIAEWKDVKPPSVGAINAVFKRWEELGFAHIRTKPVRFTGYTEVGVELGLEGLKARRKQQKRIHEQMIGRR